MTQAPLGDPAPAQHEATPDQHHQVISSDFLDETTIRGNHLDGTVLHLIVLNWALPGCLVQLWQRAAVRVCADGGANRLFDELPSLVPDQDPDEVRRRYLPDVIHGDMDSLRADVRAFYIEQGVSVVQCPDQDSTDLTKCVQYIWHHHAPNLRPPVASNGTGAIAHAKAHASAEAQGTASSVAGGPHHPDDSKHGHGRQSDHPVHHHTSHQRTGIILALGALGGRLDHTLGNINTLHMFRHVPLALVGEGNLVRLVHGGGRTLIKPCRSLEGPLCGLVPLGGPATVTIKGFRWDLTSAVMQMGGLVSTSNEIAADELVVESDRDLLFTTQLRDMDTGRT